MEAFKILTSDSQVKAILVNIFGAPPCYFFSESKDACQSMQGSSAMPASNSIEFIKAAMYVAKICRFTAGVLGDGWKTCAGGIMKCDVIASGIVNAAKGVHKFSACCRCDMHP